MQAQSLHTRIKEDSPSQKVEADVSHEGKEWTEGAKQCMESLESGKFTDCIFLVGPKDGDNKQEFHVVKSMMLMMSPFVKSMFNSPLCPPSPIRIENVEPRIFKLITEYVHVGQLLTPVECEDIADLAVAADFFLIKPLVELCGVLLKGKANVMVQSIWTILNKVMKPGLTAVADGVVKDVLCKKTSELLSQTSFLSAEPHSLLYLLEQQELAVQSEMQIIEHCLRWAEGQADKRVAMRTLLPHLRLMTLSAEELCGLPEYMFEGEEFGHILKYSLTKKLPEFKPLSSKICITQLTPRHIVLPEEYFLSLVPDYLHEKAIVNIRSELYITQTSACNQLAIRTIESIYITQIHFISKIQVPPNLEFGDRLQACTLSPHQNSVYTPKFTIDCINPINSTSVGMEFKTPDAKFNGIGTLRFSKPIYIPKGTEMLFKITAEVDCANLNYFRNISAHDANIAMRQNNAGNKVIASISFLYSSPAFYDYYRRQWTSYEVVNEPIFIKGISYIMSK